ncbi:MAG: hypothetical protein IPK18_02830 [Sphingobacteriales bacterium]|jgi:uncharacterized protein YxeA|nr:MAG: hypothetical protein IPK18_02830 [Sphingobacteriales bacterium]
MMKNIFLIILTLVIIISIAKPPKKNTNTNNTSSWVENKTIYGKWEWLKTECCGKKKGTTTPDTYGDKIILELLPNNTFAENANKYRVPRSGNITLSKVNSYDKQVKTIQFNDERPAYYSLSQNGDTLILSWEHLELQKEYYLKTK